MSAFNEIELFQRERKTDPRGWLLKVLTGTEKHLPDEMGEIYLISAHAGEARANHYHPLANEWFTVVQGSALIILEDVETRQRSEIRMSSGDPCTIFVPAGVAHAVVADLPEVSPMLLIAYSDRRYDPKDTIPYRLAVSR